MGGHQILMLILGISTFGAVAALWSLVVLARHHQSARVHQVLRKRLIGRERVAGAGPTRTLRLWHEGREATTEVADGASKPSRRERFARHCREAGWEASPGKLVLRLVALAALSGLALYAVSGELVGLPVGAALTVFVFWWISTRRVHKAIVLFDHQLVDALGLAARSLRAGHPLIGSFQLIADEVPAPVGRIFSDICREQDVGVPLEASLERAAALTESRDMRLFSAALGINLRTGGNLADVLDGLAEIIRERLRLSRRFRVLTAQTQFSKRTLLVLPVLLFGVINVLNPKYTSQLYNTADGQVLLGIASALLLAGWIVMNKMAQIHE